MEFQTDCGPIEEETLITFMQIWEKTFKVQITKEKAAGYLATALAMDLLHSVGNRNGRTRIIE